MSNFIPNKEHLRTVLLHYFILKKKPAETYCILQDAYGEHAPSQNTCERWFNRFKGGDFGLENEEHGKPPKKFEDTELQTILDKDPNLTQIQMAEMLNVTQKTISERLHAMGIIQKEGKWEPHELNDRQMENRKRIRKKEENDFE